MKFDVIRLNEIVEVCRLFADARGFGLHVPDEAVAGLKEEVKAFNEEFETKIIV